MTLEIVAVGHALTYAIAQSLWQGFGIALLLESALLLFNSLSSRMRYGLSLTALLTQFLWFVETFATASWSFRHTQLDMRIPSLSGPLLSLARDHVQVVEARSTLAGYIVMFWLCGVLIMSLRTIAGCLMVRRVRQIYVHPVSQEFIENVKVLGQRLGIKRRIHAVTSLMVDSPVTVGFIKPIILMPPSMLFGLSPNQLEAILLHELAHVLRYDYLINLIQHVIENLLFYHPAVWWMSSKVKDERENVCDDIAVEITGDALVYATALADLEANRMSGGLMMAANGGLLSRRINRILRSGATKRSAVGALTGCALILMLFVSSIAITSLAATSRLGGSLTRGFGIHSNGHLKLHGFIGEQDDRKAGTQVEGKDYAWVKYGDREYVIQDPIIVRRIFSLYQEAIICSQNVKPDAGNKSLITMCGMSPSELARARSMPDYSPQISSRTKLAMSRVWSQLDQAIADGTARIIHS